MTEIPTVTFITRAGCHLCELALAEVQRARTEVGFGLQRLDVDADPELRAEYGDQVPVVLLNGELHSYFRVDAQRLVRDVRAAAGAPAP